MDTVKGKVLMMGPKRCGKTRVADFLSKHADAPNFQEYKPTKGTRILEFEENVQAGRKNVSLSVELWDCSGDRQYESCWPAILKGAHGVVLVYDPTIKEQEKDIELWYKSYTARLGLKDAQVLIFAHTTSTGGRSTYQAPRALDKFEYLNTTLDSEDVSRSMRDKFRSFLGHVASAAMNKATSDLDAQMAGL